MAIINLLYNESLEKFIKSLKIDSAQKKELISKVPGMNLEQRKKLFRILTDVYLLDQEEKEALEKIEKFWEE